MNKKLAKIKNARLSLDRDCFLTFWFDLEYEGNSGQGFGGYCLDTYDEDKEKRVGTAGGCDAIRQLLELFKVNDFREMKGRIVWALTEGKGFGSKVVGLQIPDFDGGGKFLIDEWRKEWGYEEE